MALDKLLVISLVLFSLAEVFVLVSLALPNWLVSSVNGELRIGLLSACLTLQGGPNEVCFSHRPANTAWLLVFALVVAGVLGLLGTVGLLAASHRKASLADPARWLGFVSMLVLSAAAVVFPLGFSSEQVGGDLYNLPLLYHVSVSYVFFFVALWMTVLAELFMGRGCIPRF